MTLDSQWPVQQAVYQALRASAGLVALLAKGADSIFDDVPQNEPEPYVTIGPLTGAPWDTKTEDGMEQTLQIGSWSVEPGFRELKLIQAEITAALDRQPLVVAGHQHVYTVMEFSETFRDPDGVTRQGTQRFRIWTDG